MSDPGRFVDESFRTPQGQSSPSQVQEDHSDEGASPELTTRSGRKRRIVVKTTKSTGKKSKMSKPATSAEIEALLKSAMGGMETRLNGKLETLEEKVCQANSDIKKLENRVVNHESETDNRLDRLERMIGSRQPDQPLTFMSGSVGALAASSSTDSFHTAPGSLASSSSEIQARLARRSESYWHCRKSLRIWPITGPDLPAAVISFLEKELGFEPGDIRPDDFTVERFHEGRKVLQKKKEVIVTFSSVSLRDAVRAGAFNLSKEAGMRIHVPDFLKANFRHLDGVCYDLKQKHPSLKRNIKFDDDEMDLYADVQLTRDSQWKRLLPAEARISRVKGNFVPERTTFTADALDELLSAPQDASSNVTGANSVPLTER